tara:strand:- start:198 stop:728 length:531 start_codon:yes stop_codon:yes gene_type:complete
MILNCNSCGKKFVVPDNAISASGRIVQCGSCGNKWKQFPTNESKITKTGSGARQVTTKPQKIETKLQKIKKAKKRTARKSREIDLYSPEYLAKKHGIKLNNDNDTVKKTSSFNNVSLGFYNWLLIFIIIIIIISRGLYFFQDFVIQKLPFAEFYIDYFFESIRNMFEIWKNLISNY